MDNGHRNGSGDHGAVDLELRWATDPREVSVRRDHSAADVLSLRNSIRIEHTLADHGARRLWDALNSDGYVPTFGALTGSQAVQMAAAGLRAIYVSGWQVAADANGAGRAPGTTDWSATSTTQSATCCRPSTTPGRAGIPSSSTSATTAR